MADMDDLPCGGMCSDYTDRHLCRRCAHWETVTREEQDAEIASMDAHAVAGDDQ